jgi:hypothetical protein
MVKGKEQERKMSPQINTPKSTRVEESVEFWLLNDESLGELARLAVQTFRTYPIAARELMNALSESTCDDIEVTYTAVLGVIPLFDESFSTRELPPRFTYGDLRRDFEKRGHPLIAPTLFDLESRPDLW